jgi:hypothetical protein
MARIRIVTRVVRPPPAPPGKLYPLINGCCASLTDCYVSLIKDDGTEVSLDGGMITAIEWVASGSDACTARITFASTEVDVEGEWEST